MQPVVHTNKFAPTTLPTAFFRIIGEVLEDAHGFVQMSTKLGSRRIVDWLANNYQESADAHFSPYDLFLEKDLQQIIQKSPPQVSRRDALQITY